ncbi:MAG TPA: cobalamin-binding protein [Candidatus Binatia bacterium]|jgi:iron complex transport system substrate-binding protein|nr:cobalamin-binding protein [Candidatus Binatia bacterium]
MAHSLIILRIGANDAGMRICSLLPSATEIAFALGLGDEIVGVTHECDYPSEAKRRRVVVRSILDPERRGSREIDEIVRERLRAKKSIYTIDLASFHEANPDFIITQNLCDVCAVDYDEVHRAALLLTRPPKIISLAPGRLTDVLRDIERVGEGTGKTTEAEILVRKLKQRIEKIREKAASSDLRPRVACLEWLDPLFNAGHWVPEMVDLAGGVDGFGQKGEPSREIEWEAVRAFRPEVIVLMPCGFDVRRTVSEGAVLRQLDRWRQLPAVQSGRVFAVNGSAYFNRSGPRLVEGLEILAQIIHPEIFPWQALPEAAQKLA